MASSLDWRASRKTEEKTLLKLDLDPTSLDIDNIYTCNANVGNLVSFQLMVSFHM